MNPSLQRLLERPDIWRPRDRRIIRSDGPGHATGFTALDAELHGGGWPRGALTELLLTQAGIGELYLLSPALADVSRRQLLQVWINPPFIPYAPALAQRGIDLDALLIVRGEPQHHLWACEQALRSAACGAVLYWPAQSLRYAELRKLQVAAASQRAMGFLLRDNRAAQQTSPAALRLQLETLEPHAAVNAELTLRILKQRGREAGQTLSLPREHGLQTTQIFTLPSLPPSTPTPEAPRVILKIVTASGRRLSLHTRAQLSALSAAAQQ